MKKGDIVIMPGETILEDSTMSVGIVIESQLPEHPKHVLLRWLDSDIDDIDPRDWLQVVGHIKQWKGTISELYMFSDL